LYFVFTERERFLYVILKSLTIFTLKFVKTFQMQG